MKNNCLLMSFLIPLVFAASMLSFAIVRAQDAAPVESAVPPENTVPVSDPNADVTTDEAVIIPQKPMPVKNHKKPATQCSHRDLMIKNCYLQMGINRVHVWRDKLFLNDLIARDIEPIDTVTSDKIKVTVWQFVNAKKMGETWMLEMGFWGPPLTAGNVESLWWVVYEIKSGHFVKQVEQLIQKRKKLDNGEHRRDKMAIYGLSLDKRKVKWHVGREKGSFK